MIWYLLSPLRGTSNPATLPAHSRLRRALCCLGTVAARHSLLSVLVTVVAGVSLCALLPFLSPWASSARYPPSTSHVWTSAESFANGEGLIADVSIRQAWVYGSWMKALERETLVEAIAIQEMLFGLVPSHETQSDTTVSLLHSPLLYWNCSVSAVESDSSILATVNSCAHQLSPSNITLRPSSVLAGMLLSSGRLVAADALVISVFYKGVSRAGDIWDEGVEALSQPENRRWEVYAANGGEAGSMFFRFQSQPISGQDEAIFFALYALILLYVASSLRNVKALKSRIGLLMTIALQECISILSGFTLATLFRVDVWSIPLEAYPFVILVVGLENMFRFVNELEKTSLQDKSIPKVATALGTVGHLSLVSVAQNLVILGLVSTVAPPRLAAFCGFAAICLTVDLVLFFTFFVPVMSMDLRDYGLQDSLEEQRDITRGPGHAVLRYPRVLGTLLVMAFLFMLGWHFLGGNTYDWARNPAPVSGWNELNATRGHLHGFNSRPEQNTQAVNWLDYQEYETIMEILRVFNPGSYGFSARVYNPLVVVLNSADRNPSPVAEVLTSLATDGIIFGPLWLSAGILCGTITLLLAIWNCTTPDDTPDDATTGIFESETLSSVQRLPRGHSLDIFILGTSTNGRLTSVGFDHEIRVWNLESKIISSQLVPDSKRHRLWPVATVAVDGKTEWLAICTKSGEVTFWNTRLQCFGRSTTIKLDSRIVTCFFTSSPIHDVLHPATRLLLVSASGYLTDIEVETANVQSHQICASVIQSSQVNSYRRMPLRLITVTKDNRIYVTARREEGWTSHVLEFSGPILNQPSLLRFTIMPGLRMVALVLNTNSGQLHLIDLLSGVAIYTFRPRPFNHPTLRAIHSPPQQCLSCGAVALISFSIAYSEERDGLFTMVTLSAEPNPRLRTGLICLRAERDIRERRCTGFEGSVEKTYSMPNAGVWEATGANGVAGVRLKVQDTRRLSETSARKGTLFRRKAEETQKYARTNEDVWEAWTMTATGIINIHSLKVGLFTNKAGPMCSVGRNAIAVGLAEDIVLVKFGNQLRDDDDAEDAVGRQPLRTRLAGRSRSGPTNRVGT